MRGLQPWSQTDPQNEVSYGLAPLQGQESEAAGNIMTFGGIDVREDPSRGEMESCTNLSTRYFPCLSPRGEREVFSPYKARWYWELQKVATGYESDWDAPTYSLDGETWHEFPDTLTKFAVYDGATVSFMIKGVKYTTPMTQNKRTVVTKNKAETSITRTKSSSNTYQNGTLYELWNKASGKQLQWFIADTEDGTGTYSTLNQNTIVRNYYARSSTSVKKYLKYKFSDESTWNTQALDAHTQLTVDNDGTIKILRTGTYNSIYTSKITNNTMEKLLYYGNAPAWSGYTVVPINLPAGSTKTVYTVNGGIYTKAAIEKSYDTTTSNSYAWTLTVGSTLTETYNYSTTQKGFEPYEKVDKVAESFFKWNDISVYSADGELFVDERKVGSVSPGPKQFAVVNTKLIIWPDKVYYDLAEQQLKYLGGSVTLANPVFDSASNILKGTPMGKQSIKLHQAMPYTQVVGTGVPYLITYKSAADALADKDREYSYFSCYAKPALDGNSTAYSSLVGKYVRIAGSSTSGYKVPYVIQFAGYNSSHWSWYNTDYNTEGAYGIISGTWFDRSEYDRETAFGNEVTVQVFTGEISTFDFAPGDVLKVEGLTYDNQPEHWFTFERKIGTNEYQIKEGSLKVAKMFVNRTAYDASKSSISMSLYAPDTTTYYPITLKKRCPTVCSVVLYTDNSWAVYDELGTVIESGTTASSSSYTTRYQCKLFDSLSLTLTKYIPDFEYICSSNNRLWGVANSVENSFVNEKGKMVKYNGRSIMASKLGDPTNFNDYSGLSTDSYSVGVASDGDFTGIASYSDDVICFKEHEMIRVTGSIPANYSTFSYSVPGVKRGCHKSLCVANEVLYYMSANGLYAYSGGTPSLTSYKLGDGPFEETVCGTDNKRLYMSANGKLYTYDLVNKVWLAEDNTKAIDFARSGDDLYYLDTEGIWKVGFEGSDDVEWEAVFVRDFGKTKSYYENSPDFQQKWYKFLFLRGEADEGSEVRVYVDFGEKGEQCVAEVLGTGIRFMKKIPLPNYREDSIKIRMEGKGDCKLRDLQIIYHHGTEDVHSVR